MPVEIREIVIKTDISPRAPVRRPPDQQEMQTLRAQLLQEVKRVLARLRATTVWRR